MLTQAPLPADLAAATVDAPRSASARARPAPGLLRQAGTSGTVPIHPAPVRAAGRRSEDQPTDWADLFKGLDIRAR